MRTAGTKAKRNTLITVRISSY